MAGFFFGADRACLDEHKKALTKSQGEGRQYSDWLLLNRNVRSRSPGWLAGQVH
jgi:hypothetical protein